MFVSAVPPKYGMEVWSEIWLNLFLDHFSKEIKMF